MPKFTINIGDGKAVNVGIDLGFMIRCKHLVYFVHIEEDVMPERLVCDIFTIALGGYDQATFSPVIGYVSWQQTLGFAMSRIVHDVLELAQQFPNEKLDVVVEPFVIQGPVDALFLEELAEKEYAAQG